MGCVSYVVHIYRVSKQHPRAILGVVEEVGVRGRKAFTTYDELWEILISSTSSRRQDAVKLPCGGERKKGSEKRSARRKEISVTQKKKGGNG